MEEWSEIRRRVLVEGLSKRAACREYGLHWHTLTKMLENSEPPGYRAAQPRAKRKIGPFLGLIAEILKQDQTAPRKQRHTKRRIFERLRAEHGYAGGYTAVKRLLELWGLFDETLDVEAAKQMADEDLSSVNAESTCGCATPTARTRWPRRS